MKCQSLLARILLVCVFLMPMHPALAAEEGTLEKAQLELLCALVSMSSYDDEVNLVVRRYLQEKGWDYVPHVESNNTANSHFFMVQRKLQDSGEKVAILSIRGTSSMKDAEVDLRTHRVPFGGDSPKEFYDLVLRTELGETHPLVHQGFNDYTNTALFLRPLSEYGDLTFGEVLAQKLRENPECKLILTGHSLGGAVAVLAAARLSDLGVRPEQLEVVTFGAPAVGNEAFVSQYGSRFQLTRIVMSGDPIQGVLQSFRGGYVQFPEYVRRKQNPNTKRFAHEMVVYLDSELRNFYDIEGQPEEELTEPDFFESRAEVDAKVYVAQSYELDTHLSAVEGYVKEGAKNVLMERISQPVFGEFSGHETLSEMCATAKGLGCDYVLVQDFTGKRIRDERYNFRIVLEEGLYDLEGNLLEAQSNSTTTKHMTPILASLYVQMAGRESREEALTRHR